MAKNKDICFYRGTMLITLFGILISINHAATAISLSGGTTKTTYCEFYNETMCTETRGQGCFEREVCQSQDPEKQDHCYVLWQTDNNGNMTLKLKGCFLNNIDCFNKSECVERAHKPKKDILLFCCCEGNMCNQNFTWDPAPTEAPKPHQIQPVEIDDQDNIIYFISLILVAFLFVIVMLILISYATCYKDKLPFIELPTTEAQLQCPGSPRSGPRAIQLLEVKARGRFGAVWKAQYLNEEVAVKIFPIQDKQSWVSEQEIFRLPHMLHPNILRLIGVERRGGDNLHAEFWLITAYHERGSLCDYLKANTLTWPQLCRIAESMARGLMHLHEEIPANKTQGYKPAVAHRDFKSKNVLLKSDMTACIADFGLALIFHPGQPCGDTHGQVGTRRYMAPEVLEGAINFTRDAFLRIDMYACGLVLWELASRCSTTAITGTAPEYRLPLEEDVGSHPTLEDMQDAVVQRKVRPSIPSHWKQHQGMSMLCDTMEECWDHDAEARLSASCVMERVALQRRCPTTGAPVSTPPITSCHPATPCVDPPLTV